MATIKKRNLGINQFGGFTPYGNSTTYRASLLTNAIGALLDSGSTAAVANGDKLIVQVLPEGYIPQDLQLIVSTAFTAGVTASIGIEYVDGLNDADVPNDPAYFGSGLALGTAGRIRTSSTKPLLPLAHEAWLTVTIAGANNVKAARADIVVIGERLGPE